MQIANDIRQNRKYCIAKRYPTRADRIFPYLLREGTYTLWLVEAGSSINPSFACGGTTGGMDGSEWFNVRLSLRVEVYWSWYLLDEDGR